jgi:hypothetical protein
MTPDAPTRIVHHSEAVAWLQAQPVLAGCSFVTSLPDVSETPLKLDRWKEWFVDAAALVLDRCPPEGVAIFFQTDIKHEGAWVDKGYLCAKAAERAGAELLWHKIVCRREPGTTTFGRPAYAHMLCFSRGVRADPAMSTPDVLPIMGKMTWARAMGVEACKAACRFVLEATTTRTIVDPFCGVGTALAVANLMGLDAVGVELNRKRALRAMSLQLQLRPATNES